MATTLAKMPRTSIGELKKALLRLQGRDDPVRHCAFSSDCLISGRPPVRCDVQVLNESGPSWVIRAVNAGAASWESID